MSDVPTDRRSLSRGAPGRGSSQGASAKILMPVKTTPVNAFLSRKSSDCRPPDDEMSGRRALLPARLDLDDEADLRADVEGAGLDGRARAVIGGVGGRARADFA